MKIQPNLIPRFNLDYNLGDLLFSLKSILWGSDLDFRTLEAQFGRNIFFTSNGRAALYVILKALNLPKKSKVGVPLYSCTVVFDAIIKSGYVPYFIDIDLSLIHI